jgi:hypothetical protein
MANGNTFALWFVVFALAVLRAAPGTSIDNSLQIAIPTQMTFSGTVEEVKEQECETCKCVELLVVLKTMDGRLEARLGPKAFFEKHHFVILRGDSIKITGMRFTVSGKDVALANEVRKGRKHLVLRGKYGKPAWVEAHGHTCPVCGN